jgi:MFS family permease
MTVWHGLALLRRRPAFRALWTAEVVSLAGDWLTYIAASILTVEQGGGPFAVAFVLVAHTIPSALVAPWAGALADRFDRRSVLIGARIGQGLLAAAIVAAGATGSLAALQILLLLRVTVGALGQPAHSGALRRAVDTDELLAANALDGATWSVMFAVGTALGGFLAAIDPVVALIVDAVTFFVSAAVLSRLPAMPPGADRAPAGVVASIRGLRDALARATADPRLLVAVLGKSPIAFVHGGAWVVLNSAAPDIGIAASGALTLGVLQGVRGVGTGAGPVAATALVAAGGGPRRARLLFEASFLLGIGAFLALVDGGGWWLVAPVFLWGAGSGANWVLTSADVQSRSGDAWVGRTTAVDWFFHAIATSAGALVVAAAATWAPMAWAGAPVLMLGATAWITLNVWARRRG